MVVVAAFLSEPRKYLTVTVLEESFSLPCYTFGRELLLMLRQQFQYLCFEKRLAVLCSGPSLCCPTACCPQDLSYAGRFQMRDLTVLLPLCHFPVRQELSLKHGFHWSFRFGLGFIFSRLLKTKKWAEQACWTVVEVIAEPCKCGSGAILHVGAADRVSDGLAEEQSIYLSVRPYSVRKDNVLSLTTALHYMKLMVKIHNLYCFLFTTSFQISLPSA